MNANEDLLKRRFTEVQRVPLAELPTPLHHASRLSDELNGPQIWVKRDDLTGLAFGGAKVRMLELLLGRAIEQGADTILGGSAVQSNYSRLLAAGSARVGLDCHLLLRRVRGPLDDEMQGALPLDLLMGAQVQIMSGDRVAQKLGFEAIGRELERRGKRVFKARGASSFEYFRNIIAYSQAVYECLDQAESAGAQPTHIYVTSLDETHAGLRLGLLAAESVIQLTVISPNEPPSWPDRTITEEVARLVNLAAADAGLDLEVDAASFSVNVDQVGNAYGDHTGAGMEAMQLFARTEAIMLDPVYTAKAGAALIDDVRRGVLTSSDTVIFWHTGGAPAIFAYAPTLGLGRPHEFDPDHPVPRER